MIFMIRAYCIDINNKYVRIIQFVSFLENNKKMGMLIFI